MRNTIYFHIFKGEKQFVAEALGLPIVTQGKTLDILASNIKEATELFLETKESKKMLNTKSPSIFMNFELDSIYAKA